MPRQIDADDETLTEFRETEHAAALSEEWAAAASQNLAKLLARWDRLCSGLMDGEYRELDDFVRHRLNDSERAAVIRWLVI